MKHNTMKAQRVHHVMRATKMLEMLPEFITFYKKLTPDQTKALNYYKGFGSFFQSSLLVNYKSKDKIELKFPFTKAQDNILYKDILGLKNKGFIFKLWLPSADNIERYINDSYNTRIKLLNLLDTIYNHQDCPKLTGKETLYRGMSMNPSLKKLKVGGTYKFENFISTTIDRLIAEDFSRNDFVFVITGLRNIPCIYMPNSKRQDDYSYAKFVGEQHILDDYSELVLPRGLEFKIDKIQEQYITSSHSTWSGPPPNSKAIGKLVATMKKKSLTANDIEANLFHKAKFVYVRFLKWHERVPIDFKEIKKNAKFVLDINALRTWHEKPIENNVNNNNS